MLLTNSKNCELISASSTDLRKLFGSCIFWELAPAVRILTMTACSFGSSCPKGVSLTASAGMLPWLANPLLMRRMHHRAGRFLSFGTNCEAVAISCARRFSHGWRGWLGKHSTLSCTGQQAPASRPASKHLVLHGDFPLCYRP